MPATGTNVTEVRFKETVLPYLNTTGGLANILEMAVSLELTSRKLYCFFYAEGATGFATNFYLNGNVTFNRGGSQIGSLPVSYGNLAASGTNSQRSLPSCFNVGGSATPDCISLLLAQTAGTGITSNPLLQPLYCDLECDSINLDLTDSYGMAGTPNGLFRAFLMCISSQRRASTGNPQVGP